MGLMDRVKAQANQLAQMTQDAAQEGRSRIDQAQAQRRGDMLLRQLGALVFADRTGRGTADGQARIEQLINEISGYESQNGLNLTDPQPSAFGLFGQGASGQQAPGGPASGSQGPGPQTPGPQTPGPQSPGMQSPGQTPGPQSQGGAVPPQGPAPAGDPGAMPPVDTNTNFFPPPGDNS